jgi:tRNA threonylcarbamoyladenosine biosynthesis protein TsaE
MPILDSHTFEFFSRSPEQSRRIGMRLGALLKVGDVICLHGDLGAGKTTLVQGIAQGWGALDPVSSPTFVLVNLYRRADGERLFHLDAYRIASPLEAEELDLDEMLSQGALLIEWPEHLGSLIPAERLWVDVTAVAEEQRELCFRPAGRRYEQLVEALRVAVLGGR